MAGKIARSELSQDLGVSGVSWTQVHYSVAQPSDEAELRALLRESSMPGAMRVSFTREPDYFASRGFLGAEDTTILARRGADAIGMGRCSTRKLWVNGEVLRVGYLCELRVRPGQKGGMRLLHGGYRTFAGLPSFRETDVFFTSIAVSNTKAHHVLERAWRWGLPRYHHLGDLVTLAMPVRRDRSAEAECIERCGAEQLKNLLRTEACSYQLTLPWTDQTWVQLGEQGVTVQDFLSVSRGGRVVAAAALWDQRSQRQTVIQGYSALIGATRPLFNAWCRLRGRSGLPHTGAVLSQAALVGVTVTHPSAWAELWGKLQARSALQGIDWLTWATDVRDPAVPLVQKLTGARVYRTRLYDVRWDRAQTEIHISRDQLLRPEVSLL